MKVSLKPATGAVIEITLKDGTKLNNDQITSIEVTPFFSMSGGYGEVFNAKSLSNARGEVDRCVIAAAGSNGKIIRREFVEKTVVPLIDKPKQAAPAKPAAANATEAARSQAGKAS